MPLIGIDQTAEDLRDFVADNYSVDAAAQLTPAQWQAILAAILALIQLFIPTPPPTPTKEN
jgi:hypothetical protein